MSSSRLVACLATPLLLAALNAQDRPPLAWREDWKETPAALPITQEHVANPDLILELHGPGKDGIKKSHHDTPKDDPYYVWSGECRGAWAVSLRHRSAWVDLTGLGRIRWRARQEGFRRLRLIVRLADGRWLVSDQSDDHSRDWRVREFNAGDLRSGATIERSGELYEVLDFAHVKQGRGTAFVRAKFKNLTTGAVTEETFRPEEKFGRARVERDEAQFLYRDGDNYVVMDTANHHSRIPQLDEARNLIRERNGQIRFEWPDPETGKPSTVKVYEIPATTAVAHQ